MLAWARRFTRGSAEIAGRLVAPVRVGEAQIDAGPVRIEVDFTGGREPRIDRAVAIARQPRAGGVVRLALTAQQAEALVSELWDLDVSAWAIARGDVHLRLAPGMEVDFPGGRVSVCGSAVGPPDRMVLAGPLEFSAGHATVRLSGTDRLRWLSSLARIRVDRAVLHPDGRVALEGGARRGFDTAVRAGLKSASEALSSLVRSSPRFSVVRTFLA